MTHSSASSATSRQNLVVVNVPLTLAEVEHICYLFTLQRIQDRAMEHMPSRWEIELRETFSTLAQDGRR